MATMDTNSQPDTTRRLADRLMISISDGAALSGKATAALQEPAAEETLFSQSWTPRRIVVADTNALAGSCVGAAKDGKKPAIFAIAGSGQARVVVGAHVPDEMSRAIARISRSDRDLATRALAIWQSDLSRQVVVVDLPIGEHLRPEIQFIHRGLPIHGHPVPPDADDLPTAAIAAFLAPVVIWTDDRIFTETGVATASSRATATALRTVAVVDSAGNQALIGTTLLGRASSAGLTPVYRSVRKHPAAVGYIALLIVIFAAYVLSDEDRRARAARKARTFGTQLLAAADQIAEVIGDLTQERQEALDALLTYENPPWRHSTAIELYARIMLTSMRTWTATELLAELAEKAPHLQPMTATQLNAELAAHPAFSRHGNQRWTIGRSAYWAGENIGSMQSSDVLTLPSQ